MAQTVPARYPYQMIQLQRTGTHRWQVPNARRYATEPDGSLTVYWNDGTSSNYPAGAWERVDARRR